MRIIEVCFIVLFLLFQAPPIVGSPAGPEAGPEKLHAYRAANLRQISYDLSFAIDPKLGRWTSTSRITLTIPAVDKPLTVDLLSATPREILINDQPLPTTAHNGTQVIIPAGYLREGKNTVVVTVEESFSQRQNPALHQHNALDAPDALLSTRFAPYGFCHVFAGFDQPEIRAKVQMTVSVPANWQVIGFGRESSRSTGDGRIAYSFTSNTSLSSDGIGFIAGVLKTWERRGTSRPLRILAPPNFEAGIELGQLIATVEKSLNRLDDDIFPTFPFEKLDLVITPNRRGTIQSFAGAILVPPHRLPAQTYDEADRFMASIALQNHLVRQWAGLWASPSSRREEHLWQSLLWTTSLTETLDSHYARIGFPFYSGLAQTESFLQEPFSLDDPPFSSDKRPQVDPSYTMVPWVFRGSGILHERFVRDDDHDWKNALGAFARKKGGQAVAFADFLKELDDEVSPHPDDSWPAIMNATTIPKLEVSLSCYKNRMTELAIHAPSPIGKHAMPRQLEVALLYRDGKGNLVPRETLRTPIQNFPVKFKEASGLLCPTLVIPNPRQTYHAEYRLDKQTVASLTNTLHRLLDPALRLSAWNHLWIMTLNGYFSPQNMAHTLQKNLLLEQDPAAVDLGGRMIVRLLEWTAAFTENNGPDVLAWEQFLEQAMTTHASVSRLHDSWQRLYFEIGESRRVQDAISQFLTKSFDKKNRPPSDRLWPLLARLTALHNPKAESLRARMTEISGDSAPLWNTALNLTLPDFKKKRQFIMDTLAQTSELTTDDLGLILPLLFPLHQTDMKERLADEFWLTLQGNIGHSEDARLAQIIRYTVPRTCHPEGGKRLELWLATPQLPPLTKATLHQALRWERTCTVLEAAGKFDGNR